MHAAKGRRKEVPPSPPAPPSSASDPPGQWTHTLDSSLGLRHDPVPARSLPRRGRVLPVRGLRLLPAAPEGGRGICIPLPGAVQASPQFSDKSLSAMPMAKSVATLFILISSAQISSSQRLAGSYRFLINVLTDFPDWGLGRGGGGGLRGEGAGEKERHRGQDCIWL